ncbi:HAD-IB family hydrolase [Methylosinus sporium]|uniref:HAD-IB family hydrolase n=3 Tax=Methylosinus sporium TaxID=428 RepID=A0A549T3T9_METSR|nr:HAD-IB family hydrolase [Methylosinus sporium]TRL36482.1 HAD-IB family hydrolase [Methylosinus sporium]
MMEHRSFAFFDVDETLISIKSMFDFFPFWCKWIGAAPEAYSRFETEIASAIARHATREELNRLYYRSFRGAQLPVLEAAGAAWFLQRFGRSPPYRKHVVARLEKHRQEGVVPVLVSGSMRPLLRPIARELQAEHCLCTQLVVDESGRLTGEIGSPQTIGEGKAEAIRAFLREQGGRPADCLAYGDDISDLAMLELVGAPVVVGAQPDLLSICRQRDWPYLPL